MSKAVSELPTPEVGLSTYEKLAAVNVSAHIEKKNNLNYLSWSLALDQLLRQDPYSSWHYHWWDAKPYCVIGDTAQDFWRKNYLCLRRWLRDREQANCWSST